MPSATIKVFLPHGDPKRIKVAEISNWTGKAIAAPRSELQELLGREEAGNPGVYLLIGADPDTSDPAVYVGEAEEIRTRLKSHTSKEFWVQVIFFVTKDENLTKAHIRYLEDQLIREAKEIGRVQLTNAQGSGSKLPESDRADMDVFLVHIRQLLPILGSDMLTPIKDVGPTPKSKGTLFNQIKGVKASGVRTPNGFVVIKGSHAVPKERPSAAKQHPGYNYLRKSLIKDGTLVPDGKKLLFTRDVEFSSPSAAAAIIHGGGANGLLTWKDKHGRTLSDIEAE